MAVDLKPEAVDATRRNAALNGMSERMSASLSPLEDIDTAFDVILANVGRDAAVSLAGELVRLVAQSGWLGVSGISPTQCAQVADFLQPLGEIDRRTSGEWSSLVLGRSVAEVGSGDR